MAARVPNGKMTRLRHWEIFLIRTCWRGLMFQLSIKTCRCALALAVCSLAITISAASNAGTLDDIRARGVLRCGANQIVGQATLQADGRWSGFMADICRAIAAAVI